MPPQGGQPPADPMREVMMAMEQMAGMMDEMAQRNQQMEQRIQQYEAQQARTEAKQDMLMNILDRPPTASTVGG